VDESLVRRQLEVDPADRIRGLEAMYQEARRLTIAGETSRGELA
jgi:hypothetical protein